jgi:enamine deaminase RidA (YjgF/YER057c/UK114 family)
MTKIDQRLAELGISLPTPMAPVAAYVPVVRTGNLLFVSGQLPMQDGVLASTGKLGRDVALETATLAAELCAVNLIAQVRAACDGDLDRVVRVVRLGGYIASTPDFTDQHKVMNGASSLMERVFGDAGRHVRTTIGVPSLPLNAVVEVEGLFEVR